MFRVKSCDRGVLRLELALAVQVILLNKTCKNHKHMFPTELIFCNDLKANEKISLALSDRKHVNASSRVSIMAAARAV